MKGPRIDHFEPNGGIEGALEFFLYLQTQLNAERVMNISMRTICISFAFFILFFFIFITGSVWLGVQQQGRIQRRAYDNGPLLTIE